MNLIEQAEEMAVCAHPPLARLLRALVERIRLADAVAYASARSDIESYCQPLNGAWRTNETTWDISTADADMREYIDASVAYLEHRGLLIRRDNPHHVQILDEKDATQ